MTALRHHHTAAAPPPDEGDDGGTSEPEHPASSDDIDGRLHAGNATVSLGILAYKHGGKETKDDEEEDKEDKVPEGVHGEARRGAVVGEEFFGVATFEAVEDEVEEGREDCE